MRSEPKAPSQKKPYRPPQVRSEKLLVSDLFTVSRPLDCDPVYDPRPACN
ncbi:hypothetical protein KRR26_11010 [Corallococcus sp. M34]|nr:hypothetical protein [Citreicoccus inhibens]MBJ6759522.1 hypothetical protein [Myxococcaceae bacterium JPH2]MBU8896138.1 hypothetical protein [Citreicoccus inhibens]